MSILNRLNLLVRANLSDLSGPARQENMRHTMQDMESSLRDARRQLETMRRDEDALRGQIRACRDRADQWEDRAILALRQGDEDLAREAILVKNEALREGERFRDQLDAHRTTQRDIERALEALELKLDGARGRVHAQSPQHAQAPPRREHDWDAELQRRMSAREPQRSGASSSASSSSHSQSSAPRGTDGDLFDTGAAMSSFDRMERKIADLEAHVDAADALSDDALMDPRKVELERKFAQMERERGQDRAMRDLKDRADAPPERPSDGPDLSDLRKKFS